MPFALVLFGLGIRFVGETTAKYLAAHFKTLDAVMAASKEQLLEAGCYIMPYLDLKPSDRHFKAIQRIGATGILRGEGRNIGWSNETWFRGGDPLRGEEIYLDNLLPGFRMTPGEVSIGTMMQMIRGIGGGIPAGG